MHVFCVQEREHPPPPCASVPTDTCTVNEENTQNPMEPLIINHFRKLLQTELTPQWTLSASQQQLLKCL